MVKSKVDRGGLMVTILAVGVPVCAVGVGLGAEEWPHFFGARPSDIANVNLGLTPRQLAHALPGSKERSSSVTVTFRNGASGIYEDVKFSWGDGSADHVSSMTLEPEYEKQDKNHEQAHTKNVNDLLAPYLHGGVRDRSWSWGAVSFSTSDDGRVSFTVKTTLDAHQPNPLLARQVDAARDVMLAAVFQTPVSVSQQELADVLGAGYPVAQLAQLDPSLGYDASVAVLTPKFPGLVRSKHSVDIALDHPLVRDAVIDWSGSKTGVNVITLNGSADMNDKARRDAFTVCLAGKLGATNGGDRNGTTNLRTDSADVSISTSGGRGAWTTVRLTTRGTSFDAPASTRFFAGLDACR